MDERDGVSLWRRIGEALTSDIDQGTLAPGERLPASDSLAARFGVNRHTVLKAIAHLQGEGLVRVERGRGAFVVEDVIQYRMGARTRLEENLAALNLTPGRCLLSVVELAADPAVAAGLDLAPGAPCTLVLVLGEAEGVPISLNRNYFPTEALPGIAAAFAGAAARGRTLATAAVLAELGVADFRRRKVRIRGRPASADEARHLRLPGSATVLEVDVENVDAEGRPVVFGRTSFAASRVEFVLDL